VTTACVTPARRAISRVLKPDHPASAISAAVAARIASRVASPRARLDVIQTTCSSDQGE
jgi:hypothetical protein